VFSLGEQVESDEPIQVPAPFMSGAEVPLVDRLVISIVSTSAAQSVFVRVVADDQEPATADSTNSFAALGAIATPDISINNCTQARDPSACSLLAIACTGTLVPPSVAVTMFPLGTSPAANG
jgi:hypothetical protein